MKILLTGGAGYIGSHTAIALVKSGHEVVIADNFSNSHHLVIARLEGLCERQIRNYQIDVANQLDLEEICRKENFEAVIHFAGLKAVSESVNKPLLYYGVNLSTTLSLCAVMLDLGIRNLVFSSSATVYGEPERIPLDEHCRANNANNPYGRTKSFIEQILKDLQATQPLMNIALLRYFNPAGAHASARIGEDPKGPPNNLIPILTRVAAKKLKEVVIYGDDYDTPDGTCVRDFIHVHDLAEGHVAALTKLVTNPGLVTYNLGTGQGRSVSEVVDTFERTTGVELKKRVGPRRPGDVVSAYCDPALAERELNWRARLDIEDICRDAWLWQQQNPHGYQPS